MASIVVYDANVLFPAPLRDLLIRVAMSGAVRARWTDDILDECFRNILAVRPDLSAEKLERTRALMNRAIRDVRVTGYAPLIEGLDLPDPDDRHVLAATLTAGADAIVTFNLDDFPSHILQPLGVEALHPDAFFSELIEHDAEAVCTAVTRQARALQNPPQTRAELLDTLEAQRLSRAVAALRELLDTPSSED
jgi:predicted nucleic acid-binding protein